MPRGQSPPPDLLRLERICFYFLFREHPQHNHRVRPLLEPFVSMLQRFRIHKPPIDAGPSCVWRDPLFPCVLEGRDAFANGGRIFGEFVPRRAQNAFDWLFRLSLLGGAHDADLAGSFVGLSSFGGITRRRRGVLGIRIFVRGAGVVLMVTMRSRRFFFGLRSLSLRWSFAIVGALLSKLVARRCW